MLCHRISAVLAFFMIVLATIGGAFPVVTGDKVIGQIIKEEKKKMSKYPQKVGKVSNPINDLRVQVYLDKDEVRVNETINIVIRVDEPNHKKSSSSDKSQNVRRRITLLNPKWKYGLGRNLLTIFGKIKFDGFKGFVTNRHKIITAQSRDRVNNGIAGYRFTYSICWGDNSPAQVIPSNSKEMRASHIFSSVGLYIISVRVRDSKTGMIGFTSIEVSVISDNNDTLGMGSKHFWAVIVGVAKYKDPRANLPIFEGRLKVLYNSLIASRNWRRTHIKLLTNEKATKRNILDALEWLDRKSGKGDVVLFAFMGHGTAVRDKDGDEGPFDRYDEAICPYDTRITKNGVDPDSVITDDELREIFDDIERGPLGVKKGLKGMCLIFETCLSGDLVDKGALDVLDINGDGRIEEREETTRFTQSFIQDIGGYSSVQSLGGGVEGRRRVVIMSSIGETLSVALVGIGGPLTNSLAMAFYGYADDLDLDRWVSAEEAFRWARKTYFVTAAAFINGLSAWTFFDAFIEAYLKAKDKGLNETEAIKAGLEAGLSAVARFLASLLFHIICREITMKILTGHWVIPIPTMYDGCKGELPITKKGIIPLPTSEIPSGNQPNLPELG